MDGRASLQSGVGAVGPAWAARVALDDGRMRLMWQLHNKQEKSL